MHKGKHFLLQIKKKEKQGGNVSINPNVTLEPVVKELDSMFLGFFLNFFFLFLNLASTQFWLHSLNSF